MVMEKRQDKNTGLWLQGWGFDTATVEGMKNRKRDAEEEMYLLIVLPDTRVDCHDFRFTFTSTLLWAQGDALLTTISKAVLQFKYQCCGLQGMHKKNEYYTFS